MRRKLLLVFFLSGIFILNAQKRNIPGINYDESQVPAYYLPDLMICGDGQRVKNVQDWEQKRRPEILSMFMNEVYGVTPHEHIEVTYKLLSSNPYDLDSMATSKQIKFVFKKGNKQRDAILLLYLPNQISEKVPVIFGYNFKGNHTTNQDLHVFCSSSQLTVENERGIQQSRWPFKSIVQRGYAIATMCYHDIYPDVKSSITGEEGIASLFTDSCSNGSLQDSWGAIGVWAWGASRVADYLETEPSIDKNKMAIIGHSRLGKVALWAGAQDRRFKVVISNDSGCGGAALSKRVFGENIARITTQFPHWFCPFFSYYAHKEQDLPLDQHMLLALIAPRHVYVASASEDYWADPKGEYLALYHSKDVYLLYGMHPILDVNMPEVEHPIHQDVGYHIRKGEHNITIYDWICYLDYCDKYLKK